MKHSLSIGCRVFAVSAWMVCLALFAVTTAAAWGFTPVSFWIWSGPALLLLHLTRDWWAAVGKPLSAEMHARLMRVWRDLALWAMAFTLVIALLGAMGGDRPWIEWSIGAALLAIGAVCAVFPVALTAWVIIRSVQLPRSNSSAGAPGTA